MPDPFGTHSPGLESPASDIFSILPNDGVDLTTATRAINVAQSGMVRIQTVGGSTATLYVAAGIAFPVRARRVLATGTDATGIVGLF
ncbi:hypothetical protein NBRC116601_33460 [Cognatishimia sp. WU-CL00825]|uniref:spike base protein, RCAP_Rcc01079 family n=1 Tax=Cognatishimia sp. WU-CL00825 TaxID=3127658 RepID=UPI00310BF739